jgi:hypothetical protein
MEYHKVSEDYVLFLRAACTATQVKIYRKLSLKKRIASLNIYFNSKCLRWDLVPSYVNIWTTSPSLAAKHAVMTAQKTWIRKEVRRWYAIRNNISYYLFLLHVELVQSLHVVEWSTIDDYVRQLCSVVAFKKREKLNRKLLRLKERQLGPSSKLPAVPHVHDFHDRVVNLSHHRFNEGDLDVLKKGLKYAPPVPVSSRDFEQLAVDCEVALNRVDRNYKYIVANELSILRKDITGAPSRKENSVLKSINSIKRQIKTEDLILQKADKGNSMVILDRVDYISKCIDFISLAKISVLTKDPTSKFQNSVKSAISSSNTLFGRKEMYRLCPPNPIPPRLYGLIKIHKPGNPIRPVVSGIGSPSHKLAHHLNKLVTQYSSFKPKYGIKNSLDLISKIKDVKVPLKARLISVDIVNLFTNVPPVEAVQITIDLLNTAGAPKNVVKELSLLLNITINQNYFLFNNRFYQQTEGLAMGSPLSPLLAEIFLDHYENKLFNSGHNLLNNIIYWYRYVDDILILWNGTDRQLDIFKKVLNNMHPKITFTVETDNNRCLNYLDLTISLMDNRHNFAIYRKPTYTDSVIPADSKHCFSQKMAAFYSLVNRLINVPLKKKDFENEKAIIKQIAVANGYPPGIIDKLILKQKKKNVIKLIFSGHNDKMDSKKWCSLSYYGHITKRIVRSFPKEKLRIAYKSPNTLNNILVKCKDKVEELNRSGVYQLACNDCEGVYVGQTSRSFLTRSKEHYSAFKNFNEDKSNFAKHLLTYDHQSDFNVKFLHFTNDRHELNAFEQLEILKCNRDAEVKLLNECLLPSNSPILSALVDPFRPPPLPN